MAKSFTSKMSPKWWYLMKIVEYTLIGVCLLLLMLNQYLSDVKDDFTPVQHKNDSKKTKRWTSVFIPEDVDLENTVKRSTSHYNHPKAKLSYFLVLYPCCTTVLILFSMELISSLLKDPLGKMSNLILIFVGIALTLTIFVVGLICALDTSHICMILITALSAVLTIIIFVDVIFILLA